MTTRRQIRPEDVLCAIFTYTRDVGPVHERALRKTLRVDDQQLQEHLQFLRAHGLLADHAPRLTFVGLATAVRLVPTFVQRPAVIRRKRNAA